MTESKAAEVPNQKFRRKKYLINPQFQLTLIAYFTGLAMVTIGVFYWAVFLIFGNFLDAAKDIGIPSDHILFEMVHDQQRTMHMIFASTAVVLFIFLVAGGVILSFHIAGPVYRMKKHIRELISGDEKHPLKIRKKDFFQDLVDDYNELLEKLQAFRK